MQSLFAPECRPDRWTTLKPWVIFLLPVLLILFFWNSCRKASEVLARAESEAGRIRQRIESSQYHEIYRSASNGFRGAIDEDSFTRRLAVEVQEMGACQPSQPQNAFVNLRIMMPAGCFNEAAPRYRPGSAGMRAEASNCTRRSSWSGGISAWMVTERPSCVTVKASQSRTSSG